MSQISFEEVVEKLKAEIGNLVYQLAIKEVVIEKMRKDLAPQNLPPPDQPA